MTQRITAIELSRMTKSAALRIREQHPRLSALDSSCGDGDHGSTMLRIVDRLERSFPSGAPTDFRICFQQAGWQVLGSDGGASSSLLGAFVLGMAAALTEEVPYLDCRRLAAAFEAGLNAVRQHTKAQLGDKTMMDALIPAVQAFSKAAQGGREIVDALEDAARAANAGAEVTANMIARYGRARSLGEKTRGHHDPGAASIALLFDGFHDGLSKHEGEAANG